MDFPAEISTNSYALNGSSDIAYAICIPAQAINTNALDPIKIEHDSPVSRGIERLRSAGAELRDARILVFLDNAKGELFTFYRKEDLQKDAKSIFNRVSTILRKNGCQMSSKHAIKTDDLLRPDRARLHTLFISAILFKIKSIIEQDENLLAFDPTTFLLRMPLTTHQQSNKTVELQHNWRMLGLRAQLLPNGQVLVINIQHTFAVFKRMSTMSQEQQKKWQSGTPKKVLLAPTGQYARHVGGYIGELPPSSEFVVQGANPPDHASGAMLQKQKHQIWKALVNEWLAEHRLILKVEGDAWMEVEVPLCELDHPTPQPSEKPTPPEKIAWRTVFWPTSLCFSNTMDELGSDRVGMTSTDCNDPLRFVEDWLASASHREADIQKIQQEMEAPIKSETIEEVEISHDNHIHVDASQAFRRVASVDGRGLTNIYPTPPDGLLSHVTPGVVSLDETATTPGDGVLPGHADRTSGEAEMISALGGAAPIGSGLYDEDLFDDVPGEKFGEAEMADEPNWDFFDEPDADMVGGGDAMDLDVPERTTAVTADNRTSRRSDGEHFTGRPDISLGPKRVLGLLEPSYSEPVAGAENTAPDSVERGSKHREVSATQPVIISSSPLSPSEVRGKLFHHMAGLVPDSLQRKSTTRFPRRSLLASYFDSDAFQPQVKVADTRYIADGSFWFGTVEGNQRFTGETTKEQHHIPRVGIPKEERSSGDLKVITHSPPAPSSSAAEDSDFDSSVFFSEANKHGSPEKMDEDAVESFPVSPDVEDDASNLESESSFRDEAAQLLELLHPEIQERWSSCRYEPLQRPSNLDLPLSSENLLLVAQVIVGQVSQSHFRYGESDAPSPESEVINPDLSGDLQSIYGGAGEVDLPKLARMSTSKEDATDGNEVTKCLPSFIRVSRADTHIDALSTIQPFWEMLGLQPVSGKKSIIAICIHPQGTHIEGSSFAFLQRLGQIYSNCNLGTHDIGNIAGVTKNGLIEWEVGPKSGMQGLLDICENVGSSLLSLSPSADNFMVYVVNPFEDRDALANICIAFVALFNKYAKVCGKSQPHELNLQVVPMAFLVSPDTVSIPSQAEYVNLAIEVYNRCPPTNAAEGVGVAESGAAVTLAAPVPSDIIFSLASDGASPLSKDGEVLHLAYSQSMDSRWIIVCWTDNLGKLALTMTYCLRQKGSSICRSRSEIIKEIWEVSTDMMIRTSGKWRLFVAHDGPIEPDEINEWSFLANQAASSDSISHCILNILTFDEHPSLRFSPPAHRTKPLHPLAATAAGRYGTPASTPSAAAMTSSPEHLAASTPIPPTPTASSVLTAPTPPDHGTQAPFPGLDISTDPDASLIDPGDEVWTLVLPFGLNNSDSSLDSRPALLSGFLLKRRGPLDRDALPSLGVNLIYAPADLNRAEQRVLLLDLLEQWRGLYTLVRTKGLAGPTSVLPWHVHTALTGCRAVAAVL